jgi:hypothetical protein
MTEVRWRARASIDSQGDSPEWTSRWKPRPRALAQAQHWLDGEHLSAAGVISVWIESENGAVEPVDEVGG